MNENELIASGTWRGWTRKDAAEAVEWQVRCYWHGNVGPDGAGLRPLQDAWDRFLSGDELPELPELEANARRYEQISPGRREAERPWVVRLARIPVPWVHIIHASSPSAVGRFIPLRDSTGRTSAERLLLDGDWRGWTYDSAAAWARAFFTTRHRYSGLGFKANHWQEERSRFERTGALPRMWTWPAEVARLEAAGLTPQTWRPAQ